jgi:ribonuclease T1
VFFGFTRSRLKGREVRSGVFKLVLTHLVLLTALVSGGVQAKGPAVVSDMATVALADLPAQGRDTYQLIHQGGPFPYEKDGTVFGNRERLLPGEKRGYYREYTVKTPGSRNRGARRIVCGGVPTTPAHCYYTADHYASYRRIVQ